MSDRSEYEGNWADQLPSKLPSIHIAAVPWDPARTASAVKLLTRLRSQGLRADITWDQHYDAYETFVRNLQSAGEEAAIFLEDDIELTDMWPYKINEAINGHPDVLIQFYSNRKDDLTAGARWEPGRSFMNNQCWYAPPHMAANLAVYLSAWPRRLDGTDPTGYDLAMQDYLKANQLDYWLHVPSLVQHKPGKSVINPKRPHGKIRQSKSFVP